MREVAVEAGQPVRYGELPAASYRDPGRYTAEMDRVFGTQWLHAVRLASLPERGAVESVVGGRPIVVARDGGTVRAFHNVCAHRGCAVVAGRVESGRLRCPYHGWTYGLDGVAVAVPGQHRFAGLDRAACRLAPVAAHVWAGAVWVNFAATPADFASWLGEWLPELERYRMHDQAVAAARTDPVPLNWKAAVDAFNETYHVPFVHPGTVGRLVDAKASSFRFGGPHSRMVIPVRTSLARAQGTAGSHGHPSRAAAKDLLAEQRGQHCNYTLFPNLVLNLLPTWGIVLQFEPVSVASTQLRTLLLSDQPLAGGQSAALEAQWQEFCRVLDEDLRTLQRVAAGMRSPAFATVRLGGEEERLLHFHDAVEACLT